MAAGTALLVGGQLAQGLFNSFSAKRKEKRRRRRRRNFFNEELSPLLEDAQVDPNSVDYSSIREAELNLPLNQMQNQMRSLSMSTDAVRGRSGFENNDFVQDNYANDSKMLLSSFNNQAYNVDKSLIEMQSQLESIAKQNKIQAKQLEYEYKYG